MSKLLDLVERSVIVQSLLPLLFGGAVVVCVLRGVAVPELLAHLTWATVSFWMGAKMQHVVDGAYASRGVG